MTQTDLSTYLIEEDNNKLLELLVQSNSAYHNDGSSSLSDTEYDMLYEYVKTKFPDHDIFHAVGAEISTSKDKVTLPIFMGSMNKIKETKPMNMWKSKYMNSSKNNIIVSAKLDGISALFDNRNTNDPKLFTRGNGVVGRDISYLIPFLSFPVSILQIPCMIRGEIIMKKNIFEEFYLEDAANSRNLVAGIVNQNYIDYSSIEERNRYKDLDFVAYSVYDPQNLSLMDQLIFIEKHGVMCTWYTSFSSDHWEQDLNDTLWKLKKNYAYAIDGIIVAESKHIHSEMYDVNKRENPKWAIAYKNPNIVETKQTIVLDVVWNASKDKYLKPKIKVQEVVCEGSKINFVTGFNAKYIVDNKIGKGSILEIGLSGGVIPHIFRVVGSSYTSMGELPNKVMFGEYVWNPNGIDIVLVKETKEVIHRKCLVFMKTLDVAALGEGTLRQLFVDDSIDHLIDILKLGVEEWIVFDKIGQKKANNIMNSLHTSLQNGGLVEYMYGSQVFERNFGMKKFHAIMKEIGRSSRPLFLNMWNNQKVNTEYTQQYLKLIRGVHGISDKAAYVFIEKIQDFNNWMVSLRTNVKQYPIPRIDDLYKIYYDCHVKLDKNDQKSQSKINGNVVLSGIRYQGSDLVTILNAMSLELNDGNVNSHTKYVLVKDISSSSSKVKKAKEKGIPVLSLSDFINKFE